MLNPLAHAHKRNISLEKNIPADGQDEDAKSRTFSRIGATMHRSSAGELLGQLLKVLRFIVSLPVYLLPRQGRPVRKKALHEMHPLAYLDALRGWLSLFIFTGHFMNRTWGWLPNSILEIPWTEFIFRGGFASLDTFFWISGYVLTYKAVGLMQSRQKTKLFDTLVSAAFRRYLRLLLPVLPITLITTFFVSRGWAVMSHGVKEELFTEQIKQNWIWWWFTDAWHILNPYTDIKGYYYPESTGSNLVAIYWSLGTEFRNSMILIVFCLATCKLSTKHRKRLILFICIPCIFWQTFWSLMGFMGMYFAECRKEKELAQKPSIPVSTPTSEQKSFEKQIKEEPKSTSGILTPEGQKWALIIMFLYAFKIMHHPFDTDKMTLFPHNIVNQWVPKWWHAQSRMHMHLCSGALMALFALDRSEVLQRPLLTPFSQFLGELSFGIFAVHFPIRYVLWETKYIAWAEGRFGKDAMHHFSIAAPGWILMGIIVIWGAEGFRRMDWQVVRLCKYLEDRFFEWK